MAETSPRLKIKLVIILVPAMIAAAICFSVWQTLSSPTSKPLPVAETDRPDPIISPAGNAASAPVVEDTVLTADTVAEAHSEQPAKPIAPKAFKSQEELLAAIQKDLFTAPEKTLQLSREGKARFADSKLAPEFNYYEIRSLVELKRFDEAITETDAMVARYPGNEKAEDARRHLKSHPMGRKPHVQ